MKKIILIGMLVLLSSTASEVLAQRGRQQDRNGQERLERDDTGQGRDRFKLYDNRRRGQHRRRDRDYVVNNWGNYGNLRNFRDRGFYDFDFRRGRKVWVRRGQRPSNRHIWLAGHWRFNRRLGRDVWIDGRWVVRGRNHRWRPAHYERINGRRIWVDGCWIRI